MVVDWWVSSQGLRLGYAAGMLLLAWVLVRESAARDRRAAVAPPLPDKPPELRKVVSADGTTYTYWAKGLGLQRVMSGAGGLVAGLISTGVGEATLPSLVKRSGFPIPVAAATSTVVVAATVAGAAVVHVFQLVAEGGLGAVPWNLIVWAVPGALVGAHLGTHLQGRVPERAARRFFAALFAVIGVVFILAFTVFSGRFS